MSSVDVTIESPFNIGGGMTLTTVGDPDTPIATLMTGDPTKPIATLMTGDASKPITTLMTGDASKPISTLMTGDANKPITTLMIGDPNKPITTKIQGDPSHPLSFELMNLPRFTIQDIKDLMTPKIRIRMPIYMELCFKLFGKEVFSVCMAGEPQVITEPYVPNAHERCEVECCDPCAPDTRPFP